MRKVSLAVMMMVVIVLIGGPRDVSGAASVNAGKLIFTEVSFRDSTNDWVELYVVDGDVDWTGYRIYEGAQVRKTISSELGQALATGDYIVFHEETGTDETTDKGANGYWDIYGLTDLSATDLILQIKDPSGSTARVDVVIYSNDDGSFTSSTSEANGAVADGMWNSYDFSSGDAGAWTDSDDVSSSETLARYLISGPSYRDKNERYDWYEEASPTKGSQNSTVTVVNLASFTAIPLFGARLPGMIFPDLGLAAMLVGGVYLAWRWRYRRSLRFP